jgi:hypothetical protein
MHLIYGALKKTGGNSDGDALLATVSARAEIKASKQRLDSETPSTETKRARVSPPIEAF